MNEYMKVVKRVTGVRFKCRFARRHCPSSFNYFFFITRYIMFFPNRLAGCLTSWPPPTPPPAAIIVPFIDKVMEAQEVVCRWPQQARAASQDWPLLSVRSANRPTGSVLLGPPVISDNEGPSSLARSVKSDRVTSDMIWSAKLRPEPVIKLRA